MCVSAQNVGNGVYFSEFTSDQLTGGQRLALLQKCCLSPSGPTCRCGVGRSGGDQLVCGAVPNGSGPFLTFIRLTCHVAPSCQILSVCVGSLCLSFLLWCNEESWAEPSSIGRCRPNRTGVRLKSTVLPLEVFSSQQLWSFLQWRLLTDPSGQRASREELQPNWAHKAAPVTVRSCDSRSPTVRIGRS